ncbi:MAG: hypothetical protein J7498_05900 [Sphingobium sp.]|nr:hypothetical protein [Sphingobium sp.]
MFRFPTYAAAALLGLAWSPAEAHHSFAAFFEGSQTIKLTGKVTAFRFTNPHGIIAFDVTGPDGKVKQWAAETNSPAVLMRRGWTRMSVKPGDTITVEGWPSRDGKPYLRLRQASDAGGKPIGSAPFGQADEK